MVVPDIPDSRHFTLRRQRGFVSSSIVVGTPTDGDWARFVKPFRPLRAILAIVLAPTAFLLSIIFVCWLTGAFNEDDPMRHSAANDPNPYIWVPIGILGVASILLSPMLLTQWIYPANYFELRDTKKPRKALLSIQERVAITLCSFVYTISDPRGETVAVVRHDMLNSQYVVRDPDGHLLLVVADEKPADVATEIVAWLFVAGILMILAALVFRAAASPGIIGGDKGHYYLWNAIGSNPVGEVAYSSEEEQQVWIDVNDDGAAVTDGRLLLGLAAVVLVS